MYLIYNYAEGGKQREREREDIYRNVKLIDINIF